MFLLYLLTTLLGVILISWLYRKYHSVFKYISKIPGPPAYPIVGNILQIGLTPAEHLSAICAWTKKFNYVLFRAWAGPKPYIILSNSKNIETVLSSTTLLYKDDPYKFFLPWLGNGLLTSNGQTWVKHRKIITPSFHFQILQDFLHIINDTTGRFMSLLETYANGKEMFDFQDIVTRSTVDVICECAMGTRLNTIEGKTSPIVKAMNDISYVIQERTFSILKRLDPIFYFTTEYRIQKKALSVLRREYSKIIKERYEVIKEIQATINEKDEFKRPKMAFLDNLLTAEIDGRPLTFQEIFEEVSTFMFEGHDTTASAITFAIFCLSRHPDVQQKAFNEQYEYFGNDTKRHPTYQELQEMKYLELVIKETLRLFPSVPIIGRTTKMMTEIEGYQIPKDTTMLLFLLDLGLNENVFKNPFSFNPERFESNERDCANAFDFVPFSAGPRNCIGQKFAMLELKVTISKILRNFHILPAADGLSSGILDFRLENDKSRHKLDPVLADIVTLKSVNGVYIRLKKRHY